MPFDASRKHRLAFVTVGFVAGAAMVALRVLARSVANDQPSLELRGSVIVNRTPEDLYLFWRDFRNLAGVMRHLDTVDEFEGTSVWTARGANGVELTWDAELVADRKNERIAWRSLEGAELPNHGSVTFKTDPRGRGTVVHVELGFEPPPGPLGRALVELFGHHKERELRQDLRRFKQSMESALLAVRRSAAS